MIALYRPVWLLPDIVIRVKRFDKMISSPAAPGVSQLKFGRFRVTKTRYFFARSFSPMRCNSHCRDA
jgi:hypothetical protein